jgi:ferredoxin
MGAGTCEQIAPDVFRARPDGTWAVMESARFFDIATIFDGGKGLGRGPEGSAGTARIPAGLEDLVIEAAEACPGECIYLEV